MLVVRFLTDQPFRPFYVNSWMYIHSKVNRTNFLFSFFFVFQFFLLVVDRTKYKKSLITSRVSPLEPLYGCLRRWNRSRDDRHWWRNDLRDLSDDHVSMHFNQIWKLVLDNGNKGKETCQNLFCMLRSFLFFFFFAYFLDDLIEKAYSVFHLRLNINMYVCMYEIVVRRYLYIGSPHLQK